MNKRLFTVLALLMLCLFSNPLPGSAAAGGRDVVLSVPAETVLAAVQKALPLRIPTQSGNVSGDLILESLDRLSINGNVIAVHGVLSGKNMALNANVAGNPLHVQLGEVQLPVSCDLVTRFDRQTGRLFVSPRFGGQGNAQDGDLAGLMAGLSGREYPLDLGALKTLDLDVGGRTIHLAMRPTNIVGRDNALVFFLQPQVRR